MNQGWFRSWVVALGVLATVASWVRADEANGLSVPDERLGVKTVPILLLSRPDVRNDLGLSDQQASAAAAAILGLHAKARSTRGQTGKAINETRRLIDQEQARWIQTNLKPEQVARLTQIDLQWEGPAALISRPVVSSMLQLTTEQQQQLRDAVQTRDETRRATGDSLAGEKELTQTVLATLTDVQRDRWRTMLGPVFYPQMTQGPAGTPVRR